MEKGLPMNKPLNSQFFASCCPHDCPSTCALDVEVIDGTTIGKVGGEASASKIEKEYLAELKKRAVIQRR